MNLAELIQYLLAGDLLGFFQAIYLGSFGNYGEIFYALLSLMFIVPLYIRTNSLLFVSIIWILVGTLFMAVMPVVSVISILMIIFGIGGVLFKAYRGTKASYG